MWMESPVFHFVHMTCPVTEKSLDCSSLHPLYWYFHILLSSPKIYLLQAQQSQLSEPLLTGDIGKDPQSSSQPFFECSPVCAYFPCTRELETALSMLAEGLC